MNSNGTPKSIGQLNGGWSIMLRVLLATYPLLLLWASWVTVSLVTYDSQRFTIQDAYSMREQLNGRLSPIEQQVFGAQILAQSKERIQNLENKFRDLEKQMREEEWDHRRNYVPNN